MFHYLIRQAYWLGIMGFSVPRGRVQGCSLKLRGRFGLHQPGSQGGRERGNISGESLERNYPEYEAFYSLESLAGATVPGGKSIQAWKGEPSADSNG